MHVTRTDCPFYPGDRGLYLWVLLDYQDLYVVGERYRATICAVGASLPCVAWPNQALRDR